MEQEIVEEPNRNIRIDIPGKQKLSEHVIKADKKLSGLHLNVFNIPEREEKDVIKIDALIIGRAGEASVALFDAIYLF